MDGLTQTLFLKVGPRTICVKLKPSFLPPAQTVGEWSIETFENYRPYNLVPAFQIFITLFWKFEIQRAKIIPNLNSKRCNSESLKRLFFRLADNDLISRCHYVMLGSIPSTLPQFWKSRVCCWRCSPEIFMVISYFI